MRYRRRLKFQNGKRIVCLKLRRSDDAGIYNIHANTNEWDVPPPLPDGKTGSGSKSEVQGFNLNGSSGSDGQIANVWGAPIADEKLVGEYNISMGKNGELLVPEYAFQGSGAGAGAGVNGDMSGYRKMYKLQSGSGQMGIDMSNTLSGYKYGVGFEGEDAASISVELGTDSDVSRLESLWSELSRKYSSVLKSYQPFYSVDAPADGQGRELFHLRIGPVDSIDTGDGICSQLGRNGVFCSVIRIQ